MMMNVHTNRNAQPLRRLSGCLVVLMSLSCLPSVAQGPLGFAYHGDDIPPEVEAMYQRGLNYLVNTQSEAGTWSGQYGTEPGVVGIAVLAMLAHGEDANFGPYSTAIKRSLDFIVNSARGDNGYLGSSMYSHGFATLALAEAYGVVDNPRIGPCLKKAVDFLVTCQKKNSMGGWRYSPSSNDADTTVSGAQMVALLAARNAGISVPEESIRTGLRFYQSCQGGDGGFGYTSASSSSAPRGAIGVLVFALAKQKVGQEFKAAFRYLQQIGFQNDGYTYYYLYYASQALFHGDMKAWKAWNAINMKQLELTQGADGSWAGSNGTVFSTGTSLLSLALCYRFLPIYER